MMMIDYAKALLYDLGKIQAKWTSDIPLLFLRRKVYFWQKFWPEMKNVTLVKVFVDL